MPDTRDARSRTPLPALESALNTDEGRLVPWYVRGLALGIPAYLIGVHLWTWIFTLPVFLGGNADFRQLYAAAYMVRSGHGHELYEYSAQFHFQNLLVSKTAMALPFVRPAYETLFFVPFSFLSYQAAYLTLIVLNVALLGLCYTLLRPRMNNIAAIYPWLPLAMFLGFLPIAAALIQGQDSILFLALLCLATHAFDHDAEFSAGGLIGIALFKPQIAIPIGLLLMAWRKGRFVAGFLSTAACAVALSVWLSGWPQTESYVRTLLSVSVARSSSTASMHYPLPVEMMANLHGLIYGLAPLRLHSWVQIASVLGSGITLLVVAILGRRGQRGSDSLMLATTASVLVSHYLFMHDLSALLLPIVITLNRVVPAEESRDREGRVVARVSFVLFVAPVCMSFIPSHFYVVALAVIAFLAVLIWYIRVDEEVSCVGFAPFRSKAKRVPIYSLSI